MKEQTEMIKRQNIENHDIVQDAKLRAQEILGAAKKRLKL